MNAARRGKQHRDISLTDVVAHRRIFRLPLVSTLWNQIDDGVIVVDVITDGL